MPKKALKNKNEKVFIDEELRTFLEGCEQAPQEKQGKSSIVVGSPKIPRRLRQNLDLARSQGLSVLCPMYDDETLKITEKKLGKGGFCSVFLAQLEDRSYVACKIFNGVHLEDLKKEASLAMQCLHARIVQTRGFILEKKEKALFLSICPEVRSNNTFPP